jgi:hypothetical protein
MQNHSKDLKSLPCHIKEVERVSEAGDLGIWH